MEQVPLHITDIFPQEKPETNKLHQFYTNLQDNRLTTTQCTSCGQRHWPPRTVCPACLSQKLAWVDLPREGRILAYTTYAMPLPGFDQPHTIGLIQLDQHLKLVSRIFHPADMEINIGEKVALVVLTLQDQRVMFAFSR